MGIKGLKWRARTFEWATKIIKWSLSGLYMKMCAEKMKSWEIFYQKRDTFVGLLSFGIIQKRQKPRSLFFKFRKKNRNTKSKSTFILRVEKFAVKERSQGGKKVIDLKLYNLHDFVALFFSFNTINLQLNLV